MKIIPTNIRWSLLTGMLLFAVHCEYVTAQNEKTEYESAWHPEAFYIIYPDMKLTFKLPYEKDQSGVANLLFKNKETGTIHLLDTVKNNERYCNQLSGKYDAILLYNNGKYIVYNDVSFEKNISTEVNMENLNIQSCDPDSQYWLTLRKFNTAIGTRVFPENYATDSNKKIRGYIFLLGGGESLMGAGICQQDNRCKIALSDGYFEIDTDSYQTLKVIYIGIEDQTINIKTNSGLFLVTKTKDLDLTEEEMRKIKTGTLIKKQE
ncbi:MAG: hypothetical protein LBJ72_08850 [Dysgonamonadaceae bacterium]|jgi:hypothetical protein|nr:hypothetical protein [Dysgonamonadaceae bacterium]